MPRREIVGQRGTRRVSRHVWSSVAAVGEVRHRDRQEQNGTLLRFSFGPRASEADRGLLDHRARRGRVRQVGQRADRFERHHLHGNRPRRSGPATISGRAPSMSARASRRPTSFDIETVKNRMTICLGFSVVRCASDADLGLLDHCARRARTRPRSQRAPSPSSSSPYHSSSPATQVASTVRSGRNRVRSARWPGVKVPSSRSRPM